VSIDVEGELKAVLALLSPADCREREGGVYERWLAFAPLQLMKGLAMGRTIADMNPPVAIPQITEADT
jgi:hypothetical protein